MNNSSISDELSITAFFGGSILLILTFCGILIYAIVLLAVLLDPDLRIVQYYRLVLSLGVSDCIGLALFLFYVIPCIFENKLILGHSFDTFAGAILNIGWFSSIPTILLLAINRYTRINHPKSLWMFWTHRNTTFAIAAAWLIGLAISAPTFFLECAIKFDSLGSWNWQTMHSCGNHMASFEFTFIWAICGASLLLYGLMMREARRQNSRNKVMVSTNAADDAKSIAEYKQEKKLFVQCFLVTLYLFLFNILLVFHFSPSGIYQKYGSSILYVVNNSINAYIYLALNPHVRRAVQRLWRSEHEVKNIDTETAAPYEDIKEPGTPQKVVVVAPKTLAVVDTSPPVDDE